MRIVFKGELSEENQNLLLKKTYSVIRLSFLLVGMISVIIGCIILKDGYNLIGLAFLVIGIIGASVGGVFPNFFMSKKEAKSVFPIQIIIDEKKIKVYRCDKSIWERSINDIKSIIEDEGYYYIKLRFLFESNCLCQKDLISEGTIEEFEQRFADLIVRKS